MNLWLFEKKGNETLNGMTYENEGKGEEEEEAAVIYFIIITCESVFIFIYTKYFSFYNFGAHHTHSRYRPRTIRGACVVWLCCALLQRTDEERSRRRRKTSKYKYYINMLLLCCAELLLLFQYRILIIYLHNVRITLPQSFERARARERTNEKCDKT